MDKIHKMLEPFWNIFVICCGTCSTECQTGGEEQVKEIVERLERRAK